jgi:phosphogluconate dehydratase
LSTPVPIHPVLRDVTQRIIERSKPGRDKYLQRTESIAKRTRHAERMGCANVAHAAATFTADERLKLVVQKAPNIGVITAYNDMLSAHAPYQSYPGIIKDEARKQGATAQVAGGVPAMCDGVTQGYPGMELSLFSRDVIAMGTAVGLTHDMFDAALMLGVCDKIVPGLLIGALQFGHLPTVFVPAGPMTTGLSNSEKAKTRERAAQGLADRAELLKSEQAAYHGLGTCTFYGTANSNQMLMEAMGLHVPGAAFVQPAGPDQGALREALTREAVRCVLQAPPLAQVVNEKSIVNAMVALLATGGSTNQLIHWPAVAKAAGIVMDWDDFSALSKVVPLIARVYPNGEADVNAFQAAGGPGFVIQELIKAGVMHADVATVARKDIAQGRAGLNAQTLVPSLQAQGAQAGLTFDAMPDRSQNESVIRSISAGQQPFSSTSGLQVLSGDLGRSVIKTSSIPDDRWVVQAPCRVFHTQQALLQAYNNGELNQDVVCVVRFQGPQANGMPELHKLTPPLSVLQGKGFKVALVTDGRMSGASGKVPAAIHMSPEAADGGALAKVRDGDVIRLDAHAGTLTVVFNDQLTPAQWAQREHVAMPEDLTESNGWGLGRELFAGARSRVSTAESGATSW